MGFFFGNTAELQKKKDEEQTLAFQNRTDADPTVTDYMKSAYTGVQSLGSMGSAILRNAGVSGAAEAQKGFDIAQQETINTMSPGGRKMAAYHLTRDSRNITKIPIQPRKCLWQSSKYPGSGHNRVNLSEGR